MTTPTTTENTTDTRRGLRVTGVLAASALALTACSGVVDDAGDGEAVTLTLATAATAGTPNAAVQDLFLDRLEEASDGRIEIDRTAPESLCEATEIVECLRDGRADIGVTVPDYTPQYFPTLSVSGIPFQGQNSQAITQTLYDIHRDYEPAVARMDDQGLHYVSAWPVGRLLFGAQEPIESAEDLNELRIRASGPTIQRILQDSGANITALSASETYEAVERGIVDSVGAAVDFAVNYRLMELLPYWTDPGVGQYSTFGMWLSKDAYDTLDPELQTIVDEVAQDLNEGSAVDAFNEAASGQCDELAGESRVEMLDEWDEADREAWAAEVEESGRDAWIATANEHGMDDPEALLEEYEAGLEQYQDADYEDATLTCVRNFAN
ncbi:TRAP transporter substrate-binding protein [Citricoccus muralis]|uniref:TRAP transporter substrate-binding protein DctP n=1 Tax=Citricoccus muralis TaxID=169134 RepID=A0ABY8H804_9MICC|nr:TRAP transporter substrate-binding protein DctP [Citricoccus muralis]WFP16783.1 TRAP transporter substrate-binding protein DctP [Citricoccus muralis]